MGDADERGEKRTNADLGESNANQANKGEWSLILNVYPNTFFIRADSRYSRSLFF